MARSSFYYHLEALKGVDKYEQIKLEIKEIYHKHFGRYGYRRITTELRKIGHLILDDVSAHRAKTKKDLKISELLLKNS